MSASDSSAASSSSASSSAASPPAAAADEPEEAAAPPVGTEANLVLPSAINSSTDLPSNSDNKVETLESSTSIPTDDNKEAICSRLGEATPPWVNNK